MLIYQGLIVEKHTKQRTGLADVKSLFWPFKVSNLKEKICKSVGLGVIDKKGKNLYKCLFFYSH